MLELTGSAGLGRRTVTVGAGITALEPSGGVRDPNSHSPACVVSAH